MLDSQNNHLQEHFFRVIFAKSGKEKAIREIQKLLDLAPGAVYKRLNGTTILHFNEFLKLCSHFEIDPSQFISEVPERVFFDFKVLNHPVRTFADYLEPMAANLKHFDLHPHPKLWYATNEVPFFHYLFFPELTLFKLFVWAKTTWNLPAFKSISFDPVNFHEQAQLEKMIPTLLQAYLQMDSVELWSGNIFDNTLNQIRYFVFSKEVDPETGNILIRQVKALMEHQNAMAEAGYKFLPGKRPQVQRGSFELYFNEISHTGNVVLIENERNAGVFTVFDNPNFMQTSNKELTAYTRNWFKQLQGKSTPISSNNEKSRKHFFALLREKIREE